MPRDGPTLVTAADIVDASPESFALVHKLVKWSMLTSRDGERVEVLGNVLQCLPSLFYCAFLLCFRNWHIALAPS